MATPDHPNGARDARAGLALGLLLLPSFLVVLGAAERSVRVPVLVVIVVGLLVALRTPGLRARAAWAAPLPAAVLLALALIPEPTVLGAGGDCGELAPARVVRRVVEAAIVLCSTLVAWRATGLPAAALLLPRPSRRVAALCVVGFLVAVAAGIAAGPALAEPFFGPVGLRFPGLVALVPILVAALANSVEEEVAYRGAWLGWGGLALVPAVALGAQALAFGLAHAGSDYVGPSLPVVAALTAGGLLAGLIARRTRSLALPIAIHAAADVPLMLFAVCGPGA